MLVAKETKVIKVGEEYNAYIFSYSLETCTYFVMVHEGINEYSREELAEVFNLSPTSLDYIDDLLEQEWGKLFD